MIMKIMNTIKRLKVRRYYTNDVTKKKVTRLHAKFREYYSSKVTAGCNLKLRIDLMTRKPFLLFILNESCLYLLKID